MSDDPLSAKNDSNDSNNSNETSSSSSSPPLKSKVAPWQLAWTEASQLNPSLTSTCITNPEAVGNMLTKHIVYSVRTEPKGYLVQRRYNDFVWLRDILKKRYAGLFVPSLPSTTSMFGKKQISGQTDVDGDFVRNRMIQLELFLKQICSIPFLRTDESLKAFLSIQSSKDFKAILEAKIDPSKPDPEIPMEGLKLWRNFLLNSPAPLDADRAVVDVKRQLEALKTTLNDLETCTLKAGIYSVKVSREMSNLTTHLSSWNDLEVESSDARKNECPNLYGDKLKPYLLGMVAGCNAWSQQLKYQPKMLATVLLAGIQFQLVQVEGFVNFLNLRQQTDKSLELALKDRQAAIDNKKAGKPIQSSQQSISFSGMSSIFGASKSENEIMQEKEKLVSDLQDQLNYMTRGLIFSEIDRFSFERVENIKQLCKDVIAVNLDLAQRSQLKWQEVAGTVNIVLSDFEEKIKLMKNSAGEEEVFSES